MKRLSENVSDGLGLPVRETTQGGKGKITYTYIYTCETINGSTREMLRMALLVMMVSDDC